MGLLCDTCRRPFGRSVYVSVGSLRVYQECEWCFEGVERVELPELITDSFRAPGPQDTLEPILDRLFAMGEVPA